MSNDTAGKKADEAKRDKLDLFIDLALGGIVAALGLIAVLFMCSLFGGCTTYKGGKVVDGSNVEIGLTIPGTQWTINFLSYTGGVKIGANDGCGLIVTNEVAETNNYLGVVETRRTSRLTAIIEPTIAESAEEPREGGR